MLSTSLLWGRFWCSFIHYEKIETNWHAGSWLSRLPLTRNWNGVAGTSPGVPGDILGSYEELRWMEPHMSSPSPCCLKNGIEVLHLYRWDTHTLSHTKAFTPSGFYIQTFLHSDALTHGRFDTQTLLHTDTLTHRDFYTQKLLHTDVFTHRHTKRKTHTRTHTGTDTRTQRDRHLHTDTHTDTHTH